jgi:hypothetical protein
MTPICLTGGGPNDETQSRGHVHPHHVSLRAVMASASTRSCHHCERRRRSHPRHAPTAHTCRVRHVHACPHALSPIVRMRGILSDLVSRCHEGAWLKARYRLAAGRLRVAPGSGLIRRYHGTDSPPSRHRCSPCPVHVAPYLDPVSPVDGFTWPALLDRMYDVRHRPAGNATARSQ